MTKTEFIQRASLNASIATIIDRLEKFEERLRNVEDGLLLLLNEQEKPKPKKHVKEKK